MGCLCCGAEPEIGALCRACALEVAPCDGLIADHIRSKVDSTDAEAWVVDGFGGAHAIGERSRVGRDLGRELILLAASVSRDHAELVRGDAGWTVRDLGSRNGTFVDGVRSQGAVAVPARARLKFGDVALWFLAEVGHEPNRRAALTTGGVGDGPVYYQMVRGDIEMSIFVGNDLTVGGALLWRTVGAQGWRERSLAPLEFQLLRALCVRAQEEANSPSPVRGCVPAKQLLRELPFQSKYANQENVRQVVLRLRNVLAEVGATGALAVSPGRGYYLACSVTATDTSGIARMAPR